MSTPTLVIDGKLVPLDDVIWLERRPCGCVVSAVVAVVDERVLADADQVRQHWHPTEAERQQADAAGLTVEPVTGARYRREFRGRWRCDQHATPTS
ncbi:hypothetical protein [Streptomyces sp. SID10815]|uniref:hypothetical protein n=1 Tax=Streptomyces sp. SID10815 TaxID=2706027 RepID=UPI0013C78E9F|nr:hypothetical protein [Streptomyces sp. SID10815]NEA52373.1 hypothetical protein [Streptomyces sp. SID10815]